MIPVIWIWRVAGIVPNESQEMDFVSPPQLARLQLDPEALRLLAMSARAVQVNL